MLIVNFESNRLITYNCIGEWVEGSSDYKGGSGGGGGGVDMWPCG